MRLTKKFVSVALALLMILPCFSTISFAQESEVPNGYIGIYTIEDLYCIRNDLTANYILMNDIDLTEATAEGGDWNYGGRGWNPIGSNDIYSNYAFSGVFDGNGYMIKGININITSTVPSGTDILYLGLFSCISGTVKNLTISGSVSSEKSLTTYIGGIAGYCTSGAVFENCTNLVDIYCYNSAPIYAGGIVGLNNGSIYRCRNLGKIEISGSNSAQTGSGRAYCGNSFAAGIAGKTNYSESIISQCINAGEIIAVSRGGYKRTESGGYYLNPQVYTYYYYADVHASGITSGENGSVIYCYNIGNISAALLEGKSYASLYAAGISYNCQVTECYNIASSTGYSVGKSATKSYCIEGSGGLVTGVTALTTGQMKLKSMYSGWDFDSVWTMDGRKDYYYPELRDVRLLITKEDLNHKHNYTSETITPATHTTEGIAIFTCDCGDSYTKAIAKLEAHNYNSVVTEPTCTEQGYTTYTCECGDSYVADYVDQNGHKHESAITTPATHTSEGVMTYTCHCGDTYTESIAKVAEHTYTSKVTTPATHLKEGVETFTCVCGDSYTKPIAKLTEHKYNAVVTAPTCEDKGYTTYTCECGDSYVADYVDQNGHKHESAITTPATHTSEGVMTYTCHCGDTYTESIAKVTEHTYTAKVTTPATHLNEGVETFTCECGNSYTKPIAKIEAHNYKAVVTKPTCEDKGYTTYTCECGDSYTADYKGATGHDYDSGIITTKPTCTKTGIKTFTCANCGDTYTEGVESAGHKHESAITTPATHTNEGVMTYTCHCGDTYTESIAKVAEHTYTSKVTTPATHLKEGVMTYTCSCGDTYTETIDKIATHNHISVVTDPTCTEQGYTTYTCECGDTYVDDYVDAAGHNDASNDGNCDVCTEHLCDHACHKTGITGFFWKIVCFFNRIFGLNKFCTCGNAHY